MCVSKYYNYQNEYICNVVRRIFSIKETFQAYSKSRYFFYFPLNIVFSLERLRTWACAGDLCLHQTSQWSLSWGQVKHWWWLREHLSSLSENQWARKCQYGNRYNVLWAAELVNKQNRHLGGMQRAFSAFQRRISHWNTMRGESGTVATSRKLALESGTLVNNLLDLLS